MNASERTFETLRIIIWTYVLDARMRTFTCLERAISFVTLRLPRNPPGSATASIYIYISKVQHGNQFIVQQYMYTHTCTQVVLMEHYICLCIGYCCCNWLSNCSCSWLASSSWPVSHRHFRNWSRLWSPFWQTHSRSWAFLSSSGVNLWYRQFTWSGVSIPSTSLTAWATFPRSICLKIRGALALITSRVTELRRRWDILMFSLLSVSWLLEIARDLRSLSVWFWTKARKDWRYIAVWHWSSQ